MTWFEIWFEIFVIWFEKDLPPPPFYGPFSGTTRVSQCQKRASGWTLWCTGRLTEADTPTIRLGTTPSGLTSAYLHHPPFFYTPDTLTTAQPTVSKHWRQRTYITANLFSTCGAVVRAKHDWVYEQLKFCFRCSLMPKLHCTNWLIDSHHVFATIKVCRAWLCLKQMAPNIAMSSFYWKSINLHTSINLHIFDTWFEIRLERFGIGGKMGILAKRFKYFSRNVWDVSVRFDLRFARHW